jgi:hypothetical protein
MDDEHHFELTTTPPVFDSLRNQVTQWFAGKEGTEVRTMPVKLPSTAPKSDYQLRSMKLAQDVSLEGLGPWLAQTGLLCCRTKSSSCPMELCKGELMNKGCMLDGAVVQ